MDFTKSDGNVWPIYLDASFSQPFSFCPGKATWEDKTMRMFDSLQTCFYAKTLWTEGGLGDQPSWFVDLYKDFAPSYQAAKTSAQWGGGSDTGQSNKHAKKKKAHGQGRQSLGGGK